MPGNRCRWEQEARASVPNIFQPRNTQNTRKWPKQGFLSHVFFVYFVYFVVIHKKRLGTEKQEHRMPVYRELKQAFGNDTVQFGLEVDCDCGGNLLLGPYDREAADFLIGAIHRMPGIKQARISQTVAEETFLWLLQRFLTNGFPSLAHPFRVFRRLKLPPPERLYEPVAELLRKHNTAAEINFQR